MKQKHAELIKKWADGTNIQRFHTIGIHIDKWMTDMKPTWSDDIQYREKPEPEWMPNKGDLVLVADGDGDEWKMGIFLGYRNDNSFPWETVDDVWKKIKPHPKQIKLDRYRDAVEKALKLPSWVGSVGVLIEVQSRNE